MFNSFTCSDIYYIYLDKKKFVGNTIFRSDTDIFFFRVVDLVFLEGWIQIQLFRTNGSRFGFSGGWQDVDPKSLNKFNHVLFTYFVIINVKKVSWSYPVLFFLEGRTQILFSGGWVRIRLFWRVGSRSSDSGGSNPDPIYLQDRKRITVHIVSTRILNTDPGSGPGNIGYK